MYLVAVPFLATQKAVAEGRLAQAFTAQAYTTRDDWLVGAEVAVHLHHQKRRGLRRCSDPLLARGDELAVNHPAESIVLNSDGSGDSGGGETAVHTVAGVQGVAHLHHTITSSCACKVHYVCDNHSNTIIHHVARRYH